jgi:hypothetical protein
MIRKIAWTVFLLGTLVLSQVAVAKEKKNGMQDSACTPFMVMGTWGYSETGTMIVTPDLAPKTGIPAGSYPYASVGSYTLDGKGNVLGYRKASFGGSIIEATFTGTATVNPDCTGKITLNFPGNPPAEKFIVYVNNGKEARMIITTALFPAVLVTEAKRLFPDDMWIEGH